MLKLEMRVLIAEDERRLADAIARGLRREGMAVDLAPDGSDALVKARIVRYDVVVLDRDLPGVHGDEVCRAVRVERPETGILMLTAAGTLQDVIEGLGLGADDYLAKPFRFAELVARIHALARRASPSRPPVLHHGDIELDPARRMLTRDGQSVELARKEFAVLEVLMGADGATVSAEELLERVWDEHTDPFTNVVRMTIMTLRRKLGEPIAVETVIGVGYRMA
jgi:DNA-binding response OmpR family regulator